MSWLSLIGGSGAGAAASVGSSLARSSTGINWGGIGSSILSGAGGWGGLLSTASNLLNKPSGQGTTYGGDLFKGLLSGLGSAAGAKGELEALKETTKIKGLEDRKTTAYEAELLDFYKNKDKYRDFRALDNYSQFSRVSQFAPNYKPTYTGPVDPGTPPVPKA